MSQHLLLPKNHLKQKSEEDLGEKRRQERMESKAEEDRKMADYVHKVPRMRVNKVY